MRRAALIPFLLYGAYIWLLRDCVCAWYGYLLRIEKRREEKRVVASDVLATCVIVCVCVCVCVTFFHFLRGGILVIECRVVW